MADPEEFLWIPKTKAKEFMRWVHNHDDYKLSTVWANTDKDSSKRDLYLFPTDTRQATGRYKDGEYVEETSWWGGDISHVHMTFRTFVHPTTGQNCFYIIFIGRTLRIRPRGKTLHTEQHKDHFSAAVNGEPLNDGQQSQIRTWIEEKSPDSGTKQHLDALLPQYVADADLCWKYMEAMMGDFLRMFERGRATGAEGSGGAQEVPDSPPVLGGGLLE